MYTYIGQDDEDEQQDISSSYLLTCLPTGSSPAQERVRRRLAEI